MDAITASATALASNPSCADASGDLPPAPTASTQACSSIR
jgi:hypothetical protein